MTQITPLPRPHLSQRTRRQLVLTQAFSFAGMLLFWTLASLLNNVWLFALVVPCALAFIISFSRIFIGVHPWNVANGADSDLDERQRAVRNRAYYLAYSSISVIGGLGLFYWYFAGEFGLWLPSSENERNAVFWVVLLLLASLPSAIVAWTEPDPLPEV